MRYIKYILIIFIVFFSGINYINAEVCDAEDIAKIKELSKNITAEYKYLGDNEDQYGLQFYEVSFQFSGLEGLVSVGDSYRGLSFYDSLDKMTLSSGNYHFDINYIKCSSIKVGSVDFVLKKFNEYSLRDECSSFEYLDICKQWYQGNITESMFLRVIDEEKKKNNKVNLLDSKYYIYYIIGGIVLLLVIILIIFKKIKDSKLD